MLVKGDKIPCYMKSDSLSSCCRVSICEDTVIDANFETVVQAKLLDHVDRDQLAMVEGLSKFTEWTGLMLAKVLVDPKSGFVPMRIANFSDKPAKLYRDTVTGKLETVQLVESHSVGTVKIDNQKNDKMPVI
ncbi:hypothetical protein ACF0H5_001416 [Mactra antiquata]